MSGEIKLFFLVIMKIVIKTGLLKKYVQ